MIKTERPGCENHPNLKVVGVQQMGANWTDMGRLRGLCYKCVKEERAQGAVVANERNCNTQRKVRRD